MALLGGGHESLYCAIMKCLWCDLRPAVCWYGSYVLLCNLLVSAQCQQPSVSCIPARTIPTPGPVRHTAEWCYITAALQLHPLWPHCSASMAVVSWELLLITLGEETVHLVQRLSENAESRCSSLMTPPLRFILHWHIFKHLSTQAYLRSFDEPPDHIFTYDNLLPAACSIQTIGGNPLQAPYDKR